MSLRVSIDLMPDAPIAQLVELAVAAEQLGCQQIWVYDEGLSTRDVYVTLAAIARSTETIRIGPGITNPYVRHPGVTAAAVASLDELSEGRSFLGLGAGGGLTLDPLAITRHRPLTAVRDMVATLRKLFAGERVQHNGPVFSFDEAQLSYARSDIEIFMAGRGPKMVALGGTIADGFNLSYVHKSTLSSHVSALRDAAGGRPFQISYSTMVATSDREFEAAREQLTFRLVDSPPAVKELIGMTDGDTRAIRASLAEGGPTLAARHVRDEWIPAFVIAGTPAECASELMELIDDHGIDEFHVPVLGSDSAAELLERSAAIFS